MWTEQEEEEVKELLREHPSKTYAEIAEMASKDTTKKAINHKNNRDWNIERDVEYTTPVAGKGSENGNWKGGKTTHTSGYPMIYRPEHHRASNNYVFEHILAAEEKLGRKLKENEVVHHVNGVKTDNRPENLKVLSKQEHDWRFNRSESRFSIEEKEGLYRGKKIARGLSLPKEIMDCINDEFYVEKKENEVIIRLN